MLFTLFLGSRRPRRAATDRPPGRLGAVAMACLLAGTSLTVLAHSGWAQVIGVIGLGAFAASGFVLAATMRGDEAAERTSTSA